MADCEAEPVDVAGGEPAAAGAPVHGGANTVAAAGAGADEDAPVTAGAQAAGAAVTHTHADGGGGEGGEGGHDAAYVYPEGDDGPIMWDTLVEEVVRTWAHPVPAIAAAAAATAEWSKPLHSHPRCPALT